jgi:DNA-binding NtrC family response regulator
MRATFNEECYFTPSTSDKHVLVVDDDPSMLSIVGRALSGYGISRARDATEGLAILSGNDRIDLLIADYLMPRIAGDELVGRARLWRPALSVLIMTGYGHVLAATDAEWWASVPHIDKPFTVEALRERVCALIGPP